MEVNKPRIFTRQDIRKYAGDMLDILRANEISSVGDFGRFNGESFGVNGIESVEDFEVKKRLSEADYWKSAEWSLDPDKPPYLENVGECVEEEFGSKGGLVKLGFIKGGKNPDSSYYLEYFQDERKPITIWMNLSQNGSFISFTCSEHIPGYEKKDNDDENSFYHRFFGVDFGEIIKGLEDLVLIGI